ncbi:hypothetical protein [Stenotrophomonas maltophilia]|uniref:hypothetical protein n=1 Tax=Stenotrophomonas maltophilia TaxID=40324 RepID=UPI00210CEA11|nr:hypothetical protein [Stenotrophomonas maltophilia]
MSTQLVPEEEGGRPRRVLALDFHGQLEDYSRSGATIERVCAGAGAVGLTRIRRLGEDLFCCGVHGMVYHRSKTEWKQLPTNFPKPEHRTLKDDLDSLDFDSWVESVAHVFEFDGMVPLPIDPVERETELRRKYAGTRAEITESLKSPAFTQMRANLDVASVNDLCGTGVADLYAIGSDGLIAHWNGLNWTHPDPVATADLLHAYRTDDGHCIFVCTEGTIVTGNISNGFGRLPHDASGHINFNSACQHGQQIYIGTEYAGLYVYSLVTGVLEPLLEGIPEELRDATIVDISSAGSVLWVLTPWDLLRFDGTEWQVIVHPDNG